MSDSLRHTLPSVTVVVMAFNEVNSLAAVVAEIDGVLAGLPAASEILIIDDGSDDGTGALSDKLTDASRIRVIHHSPNQGLGEVYRTGFTDARMECVTFFPADGQFPGTIIATFLSLMPARDLVLGYLEDRNDPPLGRFLSWAQRVVYRVLAGRLPRFQGVLMMRSEYARGLQLKSRGRAATIVFEMLLRAVRDGARITSVATALRPRQHGTSKVNNFRTIVSNLRQAIRLRRILSN